MPCELLFSFFNEENLDSKDKLQEWIINICVQKNDGMYWAISVVIL